MVASPSARPVPGAAALLLALLMTVPTFAGVAGAQTAPGTWALSLDKAQTRLTFDGTFSDATFVSTGDHVTVRTVIQNSGSVAAPRVPVYFWFTDLTNKTQNACVLSTPVGAAQSDLQSRTNGIGWANWTFLVPADAGHFGWDVSISLNRAPDAGANIAPCSGYPAEVHGTDLNGGPSSTGLNDPAGSADVEAATHHDKGYFVRDRRVDYQVSAASWCTYAQTPATIDENLAPEGCTDLGPTNLANRTSNVQATNYAFLKVKLWNKGTWPYDTNNATGQPWAIPFAARLDGLNKPNADVSVKHAALPWTNNQTRIVAAVDLFQLAGAYNASFVVNTTTFASGDLAQRTTYRPLNVSYWDFAVAVNATDFRNATNPYPSSGGFRITGNFTLQNLGNARVASSDTNVNVEAWIDSRDGNFYHNYTGSFTTLGNATSGGLRAFALPGWDVSDVSSAPNYLSPGLHTLHVEADLVRKGAWGEYYESNESNNAVDFPLYVQSELGPQFFTGVAITAKGGPQSDANNPSISSTHSHQQFFVSVGVTGDDVPHYDVVANFTLVGNSSVYRVRNMTHQVAGVYSGSTGGVSNDRFVVAPNDFGYYGTNGTFQLWNVTVEARDPFGHLNTTRLSNFRLDRWPIHALTLQDILLAPVKDNATFSWPAQSPPIQIRVWDNWTGYTNQADSSDNQILRTDNLNVTFWPPKNAAPAYSSFSSVVSSCTTTKTPGTPDVGGSVPGTGTSTPSPSSNTWNNTNCDGQPPATNGASRYAFDVKPVSPLPGVPGVWHVAIRVSDVANESKTFNLTLNLLDFPPALTEQDLNDVTDKNLSGARTANAGDKVQVRVNASDDFDINQTWLQLDRADGFQMRLNLTNATMGSDNGNTTYLYKDELTVGRTGQIKYAGNYTVRYFAQDTNGNVNNSTPFSFVFLGDQPRFDSANGHTGVDQANQELNQPVTFFAHVDSLYQPRVELTVTKGQVVVVDRRVLASNGGVGVAENFTAALPFAEAGTYHYTLRIVDSQNRTVDAPNAVWTGDVVVSANLGPRIEVRSPDANVNGQLYAPASPTLSFLVYDAEGVDTSTFNLTIDGTTVQPVTSPAPPGVNGYYFSYTVPQPYANGQSVVVNVSVSDLSGLTPGKTSLPSFLNFTFVVDARAPGAKLADFTPRYRAGGSGLYNVSFATRFVLNASKDDDSPVPIDRIMYTVAGGGRSVTATYGGPFTFADLRDVYAGSTTYTLSVWAYDEVGNSNASHPNQYSFFLDDEAPHLALPLPQGRYINFTIVDDQTGVKSATLWAKIDAGAYQAIPMTKDAVGDVWRAMLPEARKGSTVSYYVQAVDNVDNNADNTESFGSAANPYGSYKVQNHEPTVKVTSPAIGSRISRVVDLAWTASDSDSDALVFTLLFKAPGHDSFQELTKLESSDARKYTLDTSKFADGEYTFRVVASDGVAAKADETTVIIVNSAAAIGSVSSPANALPGDSVLITAEIRKAGATVEAQLYRGGVIVDSFAMNDDGQDGDVTAGDHVYSARVRASSPGDYSVTIVAHYQEDGQTRDPSLANAASFSVKLTPGYILTEYAGILVTLALLAVIGIGVAVFVVLRKR